MANSGFILVARQRQGFFCFQETSPNVDSCCGACSSQVLNHQSSPTRSSWRKTETAVIKTSRSLGGRAALPFASVCVWSWRWRWWKAWAWTSAVHEMQHGHVAPVFLLPHCSGVVWRHKPPCERVPSARKHNTGRQQIPNIIYVFVNKAVEQAEKYS